MSIYNRHVIQGFKHRGLKRLYETGEGKGISRERLPAAVRILSLLDVASHPKDLDLPGFHCHAVRGEQKRTWTLTASGNCKVAFRFEQGHVLDVEMVEA